MPGLLKHAYNHIGTHFPERLVFNSDKLAGLGFEALVMRDKQ